MRSVKLAIEKTLKMGDLTISNVPFYVTIIQSGHAEADRYMNHFQLVVGRNITVKYLTIDFQSSTIVVKYKSDIPATVKPNLCISSGGIYRLLCHTFNGTPLMMNPDTGDASYGILYSTMLPVVQKNCSLKLARKKRRMAGAGGVFESQYYNVTDIPLSISDSDVLIPQIALLTNDKK